jgi:hypothetical protein
VEGELLASLRRSRRALLMLMIGSGVTLACAGDRQDDDHAARGDEAGERHGAAAAGVGIAVHRDTS